MKSSKNTISEPFDLDNHRQPNFLYTAVGFVAALALVSVTPYGWFNGEGSTAEKTETVSLAAEVSSYDRALLNRVRALELAAERSNVSGSAAVENVTDEVRPSGPTESLFPAELLESAAELAEARKGAVVQVWSREWNGIGTGWLITPDVVVTNEHVVDGISAANLQVKTIDGDVINASLIGADRGLDIALIRLDRAIENVEPFVIQSKLPDLDTPVISIGHPSVIGNWAVSAGVVTVNDYYGGEAMLTTLPINTGASGSPIMNMDGEIVGLLSGFYWGTQDPSMREPMESKIHTAIPRSDIVGGSNSQSLIKFMNKYRIGYVLADR